MKNCPECNPRKINKDAKVIDRGDYSSVNDMQILIDEEPDALIFKQRIYSDIEARICADCGFIQLYFEVLSNREACPSGAKRERTAREPLALQSEEKL